MRTQNNSRLDSKSAMDPGYMMVALYLAGVIVLVLLSWFGVAGAVIAEQTMTLDEVHRGELLLPGNTPGQYVAAPMLSMDVDIKISGIVARTTLNQHFKNDSSDWAEALYVFPLPDESAVDHMRIQIGDRIIVGKVQEKKKARKTYEAAKKSGRKASLLSQQRPNIFTTAVANIAPGETVIVQIEYQQVVQRLNNIFSLRFPMVVGPRYQPGSYSLPGSTVSSSPDERDGIAESSRLESPTAEGTISTPIVPPAGKQLNPVNLHVNLAAGMDLARLDSLYHGITNNKNIDGSVDIRFTGEVMADRDFVLEWEPEESQLPTVTLFSEQRGSENYRLLMVMPPRLPNLVPLARETIFILDTSGSMGGESIRQAKNALLMAVARMRPIDRFNVIEFNSQTNPLFAASRPGSQDNQQKANSFVQQLEARGGTEIKPALELALDSRTDHQRIRQVVFLTDACVSNENELLALINQRLGDSRLFTVGIGSAPNSYFMTRAAAMGRGSYTFIGKLDEVRNKMTALFTMLEQPAITDLAITGGEAMESLPSPLPDLYQGEPLLTLIKDRGDMQNLQLSGMLAGRTPWQVTIDTDKFSDRPGIGTLWARKKIRILMDSLSAGADAEQVQSAVTELALKNHLVSRYTSLVAVEQKVSRPGSTPLKTNRMKSNLPAGWQYDKVFAGSASTASPATLYMFLSLFLFIGAGILAGIRKRTK